MKSEVAKEDGSEKEENNNALASQLREVACVIGLTLVLIAQLLYTVVESIYYLIVPAPEKSVKGEIVLITGTGHGIGKELALLYAQHGATVVGWDINDQNNKATVEEIAKLGFPKAYAYVCDVSNRENVLEVAKKVQQDVGDVTILINNAGIMYARALEQHTPEMLERIFKINVLAHFWTLEAFLGPMKRNNHGHIVALSSGAGILGFRNLASYCATKFAVRGLMEGLFEDLRQDPKCRVKLTTIFPYMVDTGLCKRPRIRFGNLMPLLKPKFVAEKIMYAQRNEIPEMTVPSYLFGICNFGRLLPTKGAILLKDFFDSGVDSEL